MKIKIEKSILNGKIEAPPSKSYAHRMLITSALSSAKSTISNVDLSDDINATLNSIYAYGRNFVKQKDIINYKIIFDEKKDDNKKNKTSIIKTFDCNESGSTLRMFMPIAISKYYECKFIGSEKLIERGVKIYENIFKNVLFEKDRWTIKTKGFINSGIYEFEGNESSQYISGLLFALPLIDGDSEIKIVGNVESRNYILMTLDALKKVDVKIECDENKLNYFYIRGNQKYLAKDDIVEVDYSNASFLDAFNYFGSNVEITNLTKRESFQADKIYKYYFDILNDKYETIDISNCIDLGPILITFAAMKNGAHFINTKRLAIKESDRGNAISEELSKCGANIKVHDNEIIVEKSTLHTPKSTLSSHNDHRIAMSLSLLSTMFDVEIDGAECVKKSFPNYFDKLKQLGGEISL